MAKDYDLDSLWIKSVDAAALLGVSSRHFRRMAADKWFGEADRGRYKLLDLVPGYKRYLDSVLKSEGQAESRGALRKAQADNWNLRTAREAGELGAVVEFEAVMDEVLGYHRAELTGLGASITRDLEMRRQIDAAVDRIFARVHAKLHQEMTAFAPKH